MLIQTSNLDGSNKVVTAMQAHANNQEYVDDALSQSNGNILAICGDGLDSTNPTDKVIKIVALNGVLHTHNLDGVAEYASRTTLRSSQRLLDMPEQ